MSTLVRIRDLTKNYQRGVETVAVLQRLDLEIEQGDFLALMDRLVPENPPCSI